MSISEIAFNKIGNICSSCKRIMYYKICYSTIERVVAIYIPYFIILTLGRKYSEEGAVNSPILMQVWRGGLCTCE